MYTFVFAPDTFFNPSSGTLLGYAADNGAWLQHKAVVPMAAEHRLRGTLAVSSRPSISQTACSSGLLFGA